MDQSNLEKIKKAAEEFFEKTGLTIEVEIKKPEDLTIPVNLTMEEPQILIGEHGQTLAEIQRLLKAVIKKRVVSETPFYINLDINNYKKQKTEYLKEMAKSAADEVALTKKEKYLPIMAAYERRIIHITLASRTDIATESMGQEPERRVVIKSQP